MSTPFPSGHDCSHCPAGAQLAQMGIELSHHDHLVALAGNPNTGKSSVFNALTGLKQHVGNWPGKTVTRAEGAFAYRGLHYKLVDLPGTYSLMSASQDEQVARDFILFGQPDCTVVVMDATALERNLNLTLQVLEITGRVVACVNLMDEAERKGIDVDVRALSRELGVPAVPTVARTGRGLHELVETIAGVVSGAIPTRPRKWRQNPALERAVEQLVPLIEEVAPGLPSARWVAYRLLDGDHTIRQSLLTGELARLAAAQSAPAASGSRLIALEGGQ